MNSTDNYRQPALNQPALWRVLPSSGLSERTYKANRTYMKNNVLGVASPETPVTRYAKNYERFNQKFSIFMYSDSQNTKSVEAFLDSVAKKVKKEQVLETVSKASASSFLYIDTEYKEDK